MTGANPSSTNTPQTAYRRFWLETGETFPDLGGAASTAYYRANEQRLFSEQFGPLAGRRLLKTDLWDEAKNTRILLWAADQGADIYGIDISPSIVRRARREAEGRGGKFVVADCRHVPYPSGYFDAIYSMGTIEHFDESEAAVREMWRVLKPGGRAVIGVPHRRDMFLRPLMVAALSAVNLYGYGFEKSYTRRGLRDMLTAAGFAVVAETAILFMPGWLRMLDLACHAWAPALKPITAGMIRPFELLDAHVPALRRHGYLIAAVGEKR